MTGPFRSFYARLSSIFLVLILTFAAGFIMLTFRSARFLFNDVEQILNREYAGSIADELQPLVSEGFSTERVRDAIHYMMVLNPRVEIYLLDPEGRILAYFAGPAKTVVRDRVDIQPIEMFLSGNRLVPGEDPRNPGRKKPFSAAPLRMGNERGYVYIILGGERFDQSLSMIRESYLLRTGFAAFLLAVTITLLLGLVLFFLLTRRLRSLRDTVNAFRTGDLSRRTAVKGHDELADLGRSFNEMAATIEAGVDQLRLSERQRRELLENISHDLRNPLTSIQGYLETLLLKNSRLEAAERQRYLEISLRNTASLQRLVEELLELAQLEAGQREPEREAFQIAELVQDVVLKLTPQAEQSGITLIAELPPGIPLVCADIGMIERVLTNLIGNAIRFTPSGGSVQVVLSRHEGSVQLRVSDTGVGIGQEDLPHIFDRFYRADASRNRFTGGAGLGLAIARQIVELHDSSLNVESRVNEGTTFHFSLPCPPC